MENQDTALHARREFIIPVLIGIVVSFLPTVAPMNWLSMLIGWVVITSCVVWLTTITISSKLLRNVVLTGTIIACSLTGFYRVRDQWTKDYPLVHKPESSLVAQNPNAGVAANQQGPHREGESRPSAIEQTEGEESHKEQPPANKQNTLEVGSDSVVMGKVTGKVGDRSVVIGATDDKGNTIINTPMAVGNNAQAGPNSIAIGAGADAGGTIKTYAGYLYPRAGRIAILSIEKAIFPTVQFGDSGTLLTGASVSGIFKKLLGDDNFNIYVENGQIKMSITIRDKSGKVFAEIIDNEWRTEPVPGPNTWDRNFNKDSIEVKDAFKNVVLQVRLFEDRVQLQAKLYDSAGRRIGIGKSLDKDRPGGIIEVRPPNQPETFRIEPIFKYPSDLHLGELIKKE
jgi:hypothetical protein